jgi:hypothetical protein
MTSIEEGQQKWRTNYEAQLSEMLSQLKSAETEEKFVDNVASYIEIPPSEIRGSQKGRQAIRAFRSSVENLNQKKLKQLIISQTDSSTFEGAMRELSEDWKSNYTSSLKGEPR